MDSPTKKLVCGLGWTAPVNEESAHLDDLCKLIQKIELKKKQMRVNGSCRQRIIEEKFFFLTNFVKNFN